MELPDALKLDFVSEQVEYTCTDEPSMTIEDLEEDIKPMIEKKKINHDEIFSSSDAVKLEATITKETDDVYSDDDVETQPPSPKKTIKPKVIIDKKTNKDNINEITDEISQLKCEIPVKDNVKLNKNGKPRKKRVYTEEQKEKMRERMKHARATAYKNKEKKQVERDKELKYKQLMKQKRDMEMEEIEEKIKNKKDKKVEFKEDISVLKSKIDCAGQTKVEKNNENISKYKDVLKQAQFEAIHEYEKIRKARKQKKKQEKQVEEYHNNVKLNLKKELSWRDVAGEYADCF
tara:strand:+ start:166 stop:1035 length:870 start_codon:yes stop_codon:yes gene_type:complete